MSDVIRWGILGAASFARKHMAPAIHAARGCELSAIATRDPQKAKDFSAFVPNLRVHDSYDALLADADIDAVYIPLPNHLHVEWTRRAVEAGKHVLCEKPIALKADEIDELISLRDSSGLLVAEAYMIVHHPQWQYTKKLYESGAIGKLLQVDGVFTYDNRDGGNIRNRPETGGGGIRDIGVYNYGCARYVSGEEPSTIIFTDIDEENDVDVYAHVIAEFPTFRCSAVNSMRMPNRQEINFHGEKGLIRLTAPFNAGAFSEARVELHKPELEISTRRFPGVNQYVLQVENFNQSIITKSEFPCPLEFSCGTQAMIDMVFSKHGEKG